MNALIENISDKIDIAYFLLLLLFVRTDGKSKENMIEIIISIAIYTIFHYSSFQKISPIGLSKSKRNFLALQLE